jgi:hypothetical protein
MGQFLRWISVGIQPEDVSEDSTEDRLAIIDVDRFSALLGSRFEM